MARGRRGRVPLRAGALAPDAKSDTEDQQEPQVEKSEEENLRDLAKRHHDAMPALQEPVPLEEKTGRVFALVVRDRVHELIEERIKIEDEWHPDFLSTLRDVTDLDPRPEVGWVLSGDKLEPPAEEELPPHVLRNRAFLAGVKIKVGAGRPFTFSPLPDDFKRMADVAQHIALFDEFPGEVATYTWSSDPPVEFKDTKSFLQAFRKLSGWRDKWNQHVEGRGDAPEDTIEA